MKSVFLDVPSTQYLKFVFYQPYENRFNIFDQVGVVSIQVLGEPHLTTEEHIKQNGGSLSLPHPNVDLSRARYLNASNVRDEELDTVFRDKIRELRDFLQGRSNDYEIQGLIMATIEKVRSYGIKVL
jgi:hypothetical protein